MNTNMTLEKRILSVLLTVIMVFSMVPLSVFAADGNQASVTVNKTEPGVKYIAADGTEQSCTEYTELTESTNGSAGLTGWYVVKGTVNKEGFIGIAGGKTLNLILCEGATLNLQQTLYLMGGATLNIYGQNGGTGTLIVKGTAGVRQPGIGIMHNTIASGSASVNIYGGTVTAQTDNGAQPIGTNPELMPYGKVTVTIAKGLKCVKTDDQNTAYAYDNTDGTSITITKCTEHKWSYTNITNDTHDRTCDLCGTAETGVAHTTARYKYIRADIHRLICACGKGYSTEYHTYTYTPNSDGLTHTATCKCEYLVDDIAHTYKGEDEICICGAVHSATYDGKKYASLQSAIDAAAPVGGTVTLARQVNENVVSTDGTVTIDLGGNRWSGYTDNWGSIVPLTVNGGSVTLKNGNLFQWWSSSSARTGIVINGGSVTIEEDVRVMGGVPERDVLCPSITLNGGTLILKEGAVLLSGLQVPDGKVLADYLPEGTAFVKCSYDNSSDTVTVSDPQEFVPDVYTANKITEGMVIVSHTHDFGGGTACPCGFNCDHGVVDSATGKCENCGTQIYVASLVKADGTAENYDIFANAWTAAIESEGSTLKLLCNVEFDDNGADGLVLDHGKFTLDLGGFTLESFAYQQMLVISGTADIVIKNGVLINTYNTEGGGQLFLSTGNAIDVKGGSLTLDGVTLHGAYEVKGALPDGEIQSYALELYSGNLTVENCTFFGSLAVYKMSDDSSLTVKIISADLRNGLIFTAMGEEKDYDGFSKFFADGSMLFDENGKYIDVRDDNYWITEGGEEYGFYATGFYYKNSAIVKRHTHTYENGKCAECGYACPHDSGNDREASYFQKAICSVCHCEYGNYAKDTNKPTGRIEIKERTWWESFIHAITFGLFYKEKVTVEITASDDSYSQAGYDETKHAVKIEYLISNTELSLETVKNSAFTEYKGEIDISDDSRYVVYARLNDFAGNEEYISTDGFVIDTTPPVIEVDADGQSKRYSNGQRAEVCGDTQINFIDDNFDTAYRTIDGEKDKIWSSPFLVAASDTDRTERWITFEVHDKAGNISTVEVYVHKEHSFDEETGVCAYCGYQAAVLIKCSNDNNEEEFVSGDGLDETMRKVDENKFDRFYLKLYGNVEKKAGVGTYGSTSKKWTFDLNGYTISNPPSVDPNPVAALFYVAGDITFVGNGAMNADVMVDGGQLTIDGECSFQKLEHKRGTLTVNAGSFESLIISKLDVNWSYTRETALCGGHYGEVKIVDIEGLTCADLLARGYRFEGLTLEQAKVTELKDATIVACDHADIGSDGICPDCGMEFFLSVEANGTTKLFETFESAIRYAEQNDGCTVKLLKDITVAGTSSMVSHYRLALTEGSYTLDLAGKTLTVGAVEGSYLKVSVECDLTISDSVGGGKIVGETGAEAIEVRGKLTVSGGEITGNVICAKGGKLTAFGTHFAGTINCVGEGDLRNCKLAGAVTGKSSLKLNSCEIPGNLSISGNAEAEKCTVRGTVTVNNGGSLKSTGGTYKNTVNVKSGGTLEIVSGTFDKKLTAESGSKLIVSGGSYAEVGAENNVDFTLSGGEFTNITVNGQHLIDCLAEGKAFEDMNNSFIIDGRVGIAGDVKVVDHTHTCIWKTSTHEKLCGCGYVEAVDTEAPVISGIDPENNHYGSLEFTVTDENDFTVWLDDEEITLVNGKYTMEPDNETHLITATDVAGNTVSFHFGIFKTYHVTLPTGAGYTLFSSDGLTVGHGNSFSFIVQFNNGYSKTEDFKVLVNGNKLDEWESDANSASFAIRNVSENLVITVEGVADIIAPEVEVSIRGNSFKEFLNRITFGLFFKQTQTVEVKAHDFGSGIRKVEYLLSETAFADKDAITGNWTELTLNDDRKAYFSIEPNQKAFVYVRVTDQSGNIAVVNTDGVVVYTDSEAVTDAQTFTMDSGSNVLYGLKLNGNALLAVYNGTKEIRSVTDYSLIENGANAVLMLKNSYLRTLAAGEYTIRLTIKPMGENYADNSGNDAPADVVLKLTVEKKTPSIGHKESDEKIYDGKAIGMPTFDTDSDGAVTFEYKRADEDDTAYTTEAPKNVGKYVIRITTTETDTFKAASSTMEFEIQPREVTISDVKVADKTYDGTMNATITNAGTLSVNYDGDNLAIVIGKAAYDNKNVGTDKAVSFTGFELSGSAAGNYKLITQPADTTADITAKEITINGATVEGSKVYDGTIEAKITNAGTLSDNYDGENLTIVTGSAAYDNKNVGTGKTVAFTGFALAGDAAGNYTLASQPADTAADITVKEITINGAAVEASRIYDGTTDAKITNAGAPSVNYDGENLKVAAGKAAYDNKNVGKGKAVMFTGFALEGDAAANYKLTAQPDAVTADITVKEIKIVDTAVETSKIYDGSPDAKITEKGTFDGLINGDKVDIVTGKAAYDDKNVGNGKTVAFYDFALSGDDAANYVLAAQPANTTASISAKELTIADLKVKDKQYDGKNTAAIDGMPALVGVVDGDMLTLINGVPTFDSVKIGKDIAISFTAFTLSGDSVTVGNYTLTQPSGITANIVEYVATGDEYSVNSNDWINKDFVITAKAGYALSLTDTANGEWSNTLSAAGETGKGRLTFYVKNTATGVISAAVTENYKIDKTAPTGEVKLNERTAFQKFINTITFGLFFKDDVNVKLTAKDEASGVKSVMYFKSDRILTDEEVRAITDWTDNSDFDIEAKDMDKFVIYVRIEDNAGNVTLIGSDGATFDTTAPEIVGVENDKTYYVTKKIAIDDENLASVTLNGETVEDVFTLVGDKDATYVIRTEDKVGNVTEYTVYMKPISSITDAISAITADNVKSSDAETISSVERQILDIAEAFDDGESTEDEWNKLTAAAAKCKDLNKRIAEVADEITRLTDAVNGYDIDKVTSDDKADVEKLIADIDTLLDGDNLTDTERAALEALKGTARALLDRIAATKDAAEADEITVIDGITKDNVKLGDKEALETAEKALEGALRDFEGNYTDEEQEDLETRLETVKAALAAIGNAEKAAEEIGKLPSADDAKLSDKSDLDRVKKLLEGLTENEKAMLDKDALGKVDALAEKIQKLAEEANSPKTGDTSNLALWIALLFISGGAVIGTTVVSKKQKHSAK